MECFSIFFSFRLLSFFLFLFLTPAYSFILFIFIKRHFLLPFSFICSCIYAFILVFFIFIFQHLIFVIVSFRLVFLDFPSKCIYILLLLYSDIPFFTLTSSRLFYIFFSNYLNSQYSKLHLLIDISFLALLFCFFFFLLFLSFYFSHISFILFFFLL